MDNDEDARHTSKRLVVFDVEGILIPKNRYLLFELSRKVGFFGFIKTLFYGLFYESGLLRLDSALRRIFMLFKGLDLDEFLQVHNSIPLIPGTEQVFQTLNKKGYRTALISSGLPTRVVQDFARSLNADYAVGLELEIENNHLTGKIGGDVIKKDGKATVLKQILEKEKLTPNDCVMVADDRNNVSMFPFCSLRIGYNPDFVLTAKSDFVTRGALTDLMPAITGEAPAADHARLTKRKGLREMIHTGSFLLTFVCMYLTGNTLMAVLIIAVAAVYTVSELARVRGRNVPVFSSLTWKAANKTELYEFATAPIHFALGITISLLVFPSPIAYAAIAVLTLGDGGAHIFGMQFGRTRLPYNKGKTLEGTVSGLVLAFLGALVFVDPIHALVAACAGMLIESIPLPIYDNFTIPLVTGLMLWLIP
jgi:HAD superfamily phosphoserine phosphatase-like hydrolase